MKIKNRNKFTIKKAVISSIVLAAVIGVSAFAWMNYVNHSSDESSTDDKTLQKNDNEGTSKDSESPEGTLPSKTDESDDTTAVPPTTSDTDEPAKAPEAPTIERSSQSDSSVKVVASLQKESNGTCTVRFNQSGQTTRTYSTSVVVGPSYYTCSFSIPVSDFTASGAWDTTVLHKEGNGVANSNTVVTTISK